VVAATVKPVGEWRVGERVVCPKCGREGKVGVTTFRAKGREYTYWVVNHPDARKCIIGKVPTAKPEAKVAPVTAFAQAPAEEAPAQVPEAVEAEPAQVPALKFAGPIPEGVDRTAWYAMVVAASWGSLRENPTEENLRLFKNQARKVAVRLGVPVEDVIPAVEAFARSPSDETKRRASEAVKFLVARIMVAGTSSIESFAEEVRRRVEEAVQKIEEVAKVPEVKISSGDYAAVFAVFRQKKKVPEEVRERAYRVWEEVFSPGRKVVSVEGQPA